MKNKKTVFGLLLILLVLAAVISFFLLKYLHNNYSLTSEAQSRKIVLDTTLKFAHAVQAKDLSLFRDQTTQEFQQQFSNEQFNQAFGGYIEQNINLLPVAKFRPVFSPAPFLTKDGTLILKGHFPTRPSGVYFDYSYIWRDGRWKIVGITLNVKPMK